MNSWLSRAPGYLPTFAELRMEIKLGLPFETLGAEVARVFVQAMKG